MAGTRRLANEWIRAAPRSGSAGYMLRVYACWRSCRRRSYGMQYVPVQRFIRALLLHVCRPVRLPVRWPTAGRR